MLRRKQECLAECEAEWLEEQLDLQAHDPPQDDSPILYGVMGFLVIVIPLALVAALGMIIYVIYEHFGMLGILGFLAVVAVVIGAWNGLVWLGKYVDRHF